MPTVTIGATSSARAARKNIMNASPLPGCHTKMADTTLAAAMITLTPIRTSLALGGRTEASSRPTGRSAVSAASSARDGEADAWLIRSSYSSSVSRPCANAALRMRIACAVVSALGISPPGVVITGHPSVLGADRGGRCSPACFARREPRQDQRVDNPPGDLRRPPRGTRGPGSADLDGDIGGDLGQLRVRPRRVHLVHPGAEFIPGQPALHERDLERADHLLTVGMGRAEAAIISACHGRWVIARCVIARPCGHGPSPPA